MDVAVVQEHDLGGQGEVQLGVSARDIEGTDRDGVARELCGLVVEPSYLVSRGRKPDLVGPGRNLDRERAVGAGAGGRGGERRRPYGARADGRPFDLRPRLTVDHRSGDGAGCLRTVV